MVRISCGLMYLTVKQLYSLKSYFTVQVSTKIGEWGRLRIKVLQFSPSETFFRWGSATLLARNIKILNVVAVMLFLIGFVFAC